MFKALSTDLSYNLSCWCDAEMILIDEIFSFGLLLTIVKSFGQTEITEIKIYTSCYSITNNHIKHNKWVHLKILNYMIYLNVLNCNKILWLRNKCIVVIKFW